jgi:photosystem II stability/assembly factor-like uncharacterized protein
MKLQLLLACAILPASLLHAQSKVSSATFGAMEARHLGPGTMSGRITAIDGVNKTGKTLFVGTAGGGVWKTTNAGASFRSVFDKYCQSIGAVTIDQQHPDTIWVGTGESNMRNTVSIGDGLYRSTDGGDNWTKVPGFDSSEHISRIAIDPKNSNNIFVAVPGRLWSDSKNRGLYRSTDGGATWNKCIATSDQTGCAEVVIDQQHPNIVYASTWEFRRFPYAFNSGGKGSGLFKSTDGGATWKELTNGLPKKPLGRVAFAVSPSDSKNLLAIVEAKETALYISSDGGESWKEQSATLNIKARPFYFSTIAYDPKDPKRVYRPAYQFSYSDDGGYSFADASGDGGWLHSDMHAFWINPLNTSQMYVGTDGGVYFSLDRGATWVFCQNLPVGQFYHVALDNAEPYRMYGGLQDNGSWMAPSAAPGGLGNSNWMNIYFGDGFWVQPDPLDQTIAYAEYQGGNMGRIDLKTLKSVDIQPQKAKDEEKLRWNWNTPIVTGISDKHNLYTGAQYLYKSTNGGRSWARISPDLTTNNKAKQKQEESGGLSTDNTSAENHCTIFTLTESPLDAQTIWVGTDDGNLQVTTDGGKNWKNLSKAIAASGIPAQTWVTSIEPSRFSKDVVYATFDNHMYGDHKTYLAKSEDGGTTWKRLNSDEFTGYAHKIREDLQNKDLLFLGTEMGLFATVDGGANWFRMKNKIPEYVMVRDIQIEPKTNDLVLATHGRGIIVVNDISPMRALTRDVQDEDVHLFTAVPSALTNGKFGYGGFPSNGGWNSGNPPSIQPIQYYFKDRVNSGEVKIDIVDANGKLVQTLPATRRKGINKVYWNLRMTPPKTAQGGTKLDNAGFLAPMVLPGTYTAKLKVGDKEYSTPIVLTHDTSNHGFTLADRELQYKTAMELYALHEQLYEVVEKINADQRALKAATAQDAKSKATIAEYNTKLEALRNTLLASTQTSPFADERKLREQITEVYSAVAGQEAAPTNLQVARVAGLREEVEKAAKDYAALDAKYGEKARAAAAPLKQSSNSRGGG